MAYARARSILALFLAVVAIAGCQKAKKLADGEPTPTRPEAAKARTPGDLTQKQDALARARAEPTRRIVYKAELDVEVSSPADAQTKITSLVEREGGFVASAARDASEGNAADVTLVVRVPAARFSAVLAEIRRLGDGKRAERIESEDVTDEYVDLEARLRGQTRLEEQLLELLKTATTVEGALKVHQELAGVRTEIERIQGRKQLLERDVTMSTIRVTLRAPATQSVSGSKIGQSFSHAYSDAILVGGSIIVTAIRLTGVLVPIAVMLGIPVLLVVFGVRRIRARRLALIR